MTAVGLGQQGSQAVGSGFESLPCQIFYDLSLRFSIHETSETLRGSHENFRHCETKSFRQKVLILPPPLIHKLFGYQKISGTQHRRVPLWSFSALWDKKFLTKNRDTPSPPLIHKFFRYQKFCETKKSSPTKIFGTVGQQMFYRKSWYSLLRHKFFRYPRFSETLTGSSTKFFGIGRRKFFNGKSWYPFA